MEPTKYEESTKKFDLFFLNQKGLSKLFYYS